MKTDDLKFMSVGMKVYCRGEKYEITGGIAYSQRPRKENESVSTFLAVNDSKLGYYETLRARKNYGTIKDDELANLEKLPVTLPATECEPADNIRFIDTNYKVKFLVRNLGEIKINGEKRRVVYIDSTHFYTVDEFSHTHVYHICEFAELVEAASAIVEKVE